MSGTVLVNGKPPSDKFKYAGCAVCFVFRYIASHCSLCSYVAQDDLMYDTMTVRELLTLSACLRLPRDMPTADKLKRVCSVA